MAWILRFVILSFIFSVSAGALNARSAPVVLFFGDSLTAGLGLDPEDAFPAQVQRIAQQQGLEIDVINAGLSGETTAGGLRRVGWVLRREVDVFVLALGANDGLRGLPTDLTLNNLRGIIQAVQERQPNAVIVLAGMLAPPNMGPDYTEAFAGLFQSLVEEFELPFIPFLLEGVAGEPALNLPDGIHPNPKGQQIIAQTVWRELEPVLKRLE